MILQKNMSRFQSLRNELFYGTSSSFFFLSVSISFLCSVLESVLLSVSLSYISVLEKEKPKAGALLKEHKLGINKSIASILIINTIANTLGAAAVGAQASLLFGNDAVAYVSIFLTFCILYFSEIIPKTIGAIYWKQLAPLSAYLIRFFIWITYPIILTTLFVTNKISKGKGSAYMLTRGAFGEYVAKRGRRFDR